MIRGIYISASGMLAESQRADVTANNLANVNTVGFKKDFAVLKDYDSKEVRRINDGVKEPTIGTIGAGSQLDAVVTDHTQGMMRVTGNALDFALEGKGYFAVQTPSGVRYTRNGIFSRNTAGELVNESGYRVLGQNGPINLEPAGQAGIVTVAEDGRIFMDQIENNQFQLFTFDNEKQLIKEGTNLFRAPDEVTAQVATPPVHQGMLEFSNVNVVAEMVNMIVGQRAYETNSKVVQTHDSLLDKAVNEVARL